MIGYFCIIGAVFNRRDLGRSMLNNERSPLHKAVMECNTNEKKK